MNEDVTEWRRDSPCSLCLASKLNCFDKRDRPSRDLMPRSRARDAISGKSNQTPTSKMQTVRPNTAARRADSCCVSSLVAAHRSVLNHGSNHLTPAITLGEHSFPLSYCARRSCFSHAARLEAHA